MTALRVMYKYISKQEIPIAYLNIITLTLIYTDVQEIRNLWSDIAYLSNPY